MTPPLIVPPAPASAPVTTCSRARRMVGPAATIGSLAAATMALALRDPHVSGSWGLCPSAAVGIWCPGCGGLRAVNDLTHLRLADAVSSNLALVVAIPFVVFLLGRWALDSWTGAPRAQNSRVEMALVTLALVALATFTVLRNLPGFSWLAP